MVAVHGVVGVARFDNDILFALRSVVYDNVCHAAGGHIYASRARGELFPYKAVLSRAYFLEYTFRGHFTHQVVHHLASVVPLDANLFGSHLRVVDARGVVGKGLEKHPLDFADSHLRNAGARFGSVSCVYDWFEAVTRQPQFFLELL